MIDTDKYEGHAKEGWHFDSAHVLRDGYDKEITELVGEDWLDDKATQALIADAPLLLEEVKRLRAILGYIKGIEMDWGIDFNHASITITHFTGLMLSGELKLEMVGEE